MVFWCRPWQTRLFFPRWETPGRSQEVHWLREQGAAAHESSRHSLHSRKRMRVLFVHNSSHIVNNAWCLHCRRRLDYLTAMQWNSRVSLGVPAQFPACSKAHSPQKTSAKCGRRELLLTWPQTLAFSIVMQLSNFLGVESILLHHLSRKVQQAKLQVSIHQSKHQLRVRV